MKRLLMLITALILSVSACFANDQNAGDDCQRLLQFTKLPPKWDFSPAKWQEEASEILIWGHLDTHIGYEEGERILSVMSPYNWIVAITELGNLVESRLQALANPNQQLVWPHGKGISLAESGKELVSFDEIVLLLRHEIGQYRQVTGRDGITRHQFRMSQDRAQNIAEAVQELSGKFSQLFLQFESEPAADRSGVRLSMIPAPERAKDYQARWPAVRRSISR